MSPKTPRMYEVWVLKRGRSSATNTKQTMDRDAIEGTFSHGGKTYHWSGLDDKLGMIVYSEVDPRT